MLIYYIHVFRDAWWPDGVLAETPAPRTDDQKLKTRLLAKAKVRDFVTGMLSKLEYVCSLMVPLHFYVHIHEFLFYFAYVVCNV